MSSLKKARLAKQAKRIACLTLAQFFLTQQAWARAGGGGSSSDWGGSDYDSDWGSGSSSTGSSISDMTPGMQLAMGIGIILCLIIGILVLSRLGKMHKKMLAERRAATKKKFDTAATKDSSWNSAQLTKRAEEVFFAFQKAWSDWDTETMRGLLTESYYARMVLELNVLYAMKRRNVMDQVKLLETELMDLVDREDDTQDRFTIRIYARAVDSLMDTETGKPLLVDNRPFTEYWIFQREGGTWKLDRIRQTTESARMTENKFARFAEYHGFFYDPDFGWLMIPTKGVVFRQGRLGSSDVNNHVIGYYREKVVEFYTYVPSYDDEGRARANYIVAQAILPKAYTNILIRKENNKWLDRFEKKLGDLRKVELEFPDFNKKFDVFAHPNDNVSTLELLNPKFMAHIYDLPFDVNIELVGNILYLYHPGRNVSYDQMLEVLSMAFDEMKM